MFTKIRFLLLSIILLLLVLPASAQEAAQPDYPLVWVSATDMLFAGGSSEDGYSDVFHLAYKYSSDWILITADDAVFADGGVTYHNGYQYAFSQDGEKLSEMAFSTTIEAVDYQSMETASLGDDGSILTPFTGAKIGFAVAQAEAGALSQISLARDAAEMNGNLHLYDGFLYQFNDDLSLKAQIAFSEISFGTAGLLRSTVEVPVQASEMPVMSTSQPGITGYSEQPLTPETVNEGTEPLQLLSISKDYDVPPIKRIGVVEINDQAKRPDLIKGATEQLSDELSKIEGLEVDMMEFDENIWGGGVLFERAVELGQEYSVDAFIITDMVNFDLPPDITRDAFVPEVRVACDMEFAIVDCTGGQIFWRSKAGYADFVGYRELDENEDGITKSVIKRTIEEGVKNMIKDDVLAGGPVNKDWKDED